jgi:hypothetical protein
MLTQLIFHKAIVEELIEDFEELQCPKCYEVGDTSDEEFTEALKATARGTTIYCPFCGHEYSTDEFGEEYGE